MSNRLQGGRHENTRIRFRYSILGIAFFVSATGSSFGQVQPIRVLTLDKVSSLTCNNIDFWFHGSAFSSVRAALSNPSNFGPAGTVQRSIQFLPPVGSLSSVSLEQTDVVLLSMWRTLTPCEVSLLVDFVRQGGGLFVFDNRAATMFAEPLGAQAGVGGSGCANIISSGSPVLSGPFGNPAGCIAPNFHRTFQALGDHGIEFMRSSGTVGASFSYGAGKAVLICDEEWCLNISSSGCAIGTVGSVDVTLFLNCVAWVAPNSGFQYVLGYPDQNLSSSAPGSALAIEGTLSEQLNSLNSAPPDGSWNPVLKHHDNHVTVSFECGSEVDPLIQPYIRADNGLGGVDEITLDNCTSAWYRTTFTMPRSFRKARLSGLANVTDLGVAWLNGHRISAELTQADANSAATANPADRIDTAGRRLLNAPSLDSFGTSCEDSALFVSGTNELIFGVMRIGDSPTGLEFTGSVSFVLGPDLDEDGDVDPDDFLLFQPCASGPMIPSTSQCASRDFDGNGSVDQEDFGVFQRCFSGAGVMANVDCAE